MSVNLEQDLAENLVEELAGNLIENFLRTLLKKPRYCLKGRHV